MVTVDLLIALFGLALMMYSGRFVDRPGTEYKPYIAMYSLGLFLVIVECAVAVIALV